MTRKHLFSVFFTVMLFALPESSWAQYITDLVIAVGRDGKPQAELEKKGYTYQNYDLNAGNSGSDDVIIGWKTSNNPKNAITNIVIRVNGDDKVDERDFNDGRKYMKVDDVMGVSRDLNHKAGGDFLYLYYTRERPEHGIVQEINYEGNNNKCANPILLVKENKITNEPANTNRGTKGKPIYYSLKTTVLGDSIVPKLANAFKAENLSGNLYKVTVPEGCLIDSTRYIVGYNKFIATLSYIDINNKKVDIAEISRVNGDKIDFSDEKGWGITYTPKATDKISRVEIPSENKKPIHKTVKQDGLMSNEGNNVDLREITLFFVLKDTTTIKNFSLSGVGSIDYSENKTIEVNFIAPVNRPEAPDGMNTISVIDPVMDFSAAKAGNSNVAGSQIVNVMSAGKMDWGGVWDAEEQEFPIAGSISEEGRKLAFSFSPQQKTKHYTLIVKGENSQMTDKGFSRNPGWFAIPFTVKPFHSIESVNVTVGKKTDKNGAFSQENKIQWEVKNVRQEDAFETDFYLVQRAQRPDFSDAITVGTLPVSYADVDTTDIKLKIISDTEDIGTYTVIDDLDGNDFNSINPSGGGMLYYRVVRAVYSANWGDDLLGRYTKTCPVALNNYLTGVENIKVEKTKDFDMESTVKVRVELMGGKVEFKEGESPKELFDMLRSHADAEIGHSFYPQYILSKESDKFLSIEGDSVHLSSKPVVFRHNDKHSIFDDSYKYDSFTEEESHSFISWTNQGPKLKVNTSEKNFERDQKGNDFCWFVVINGTKHYLDDGGFDSTMYVWNQVYAEGEAKDLAGKYYNTLKRSTIWDKKASIVIQRYSLAKEHDNGKDLVAKQIVINGEDVKWDSEKNIYYAEIEDIQTYPYIHYYYKASIDATRSSYGILENPVQKTTEAEADSCYKETLSPVAHLAASMGTVKGRVVVEWEAEEGVLTGFKVERREVAIKDGKVCAENSEPFKVVSRKDTLATNFVDYEADAGKLYEYKITSQLKVRQEVMVASDSVYGWNPYYGTIKGRVTLKNNALIPDSVTLSIASIEAVKIATVLDANNDTIIPGYNKKYEATLSTANGTFEFDNVPYMPNGAKYNVTINSSGASFVLEGQGDNTTTIRLDNGMYEYTTLHYICNDTRQFSGRVLYANSTIPVRDCEFEMNGNPVLDANGNHIKTDSKGEFSFLLPSCNMTLRAVKGGHTFAEDGYVLARESDKDKDKEHVFVPSADYDGLILTDNTTVRLVGRLIGGNRQGRLPLGMGLTKNNLGDNMRVVLELEGDNTSRITYFKDDPNRSSYSKSFSQAVNINNLYKRDELLDSTNVTFEKKRIVIEPNVKTGEFCIDLAPTKYKITEMSATGYSTLFNEGEGFQVLDLSHSDTCLITDSYKYLNEGIHCDETRTTTYNAKYNRIVHNPVTVTYEQYNYGMKSNFLGAEKMTIYNITGEKKTVKVATYDKENKKVSYMFDYPVFQSGDSYELHVYAHEDYYFNGDTINAPDIVYLEGDTLLVNNGLVGAVNSEVYPLDSVGLAKVIFRAANPEYSLNRKDALRYLNMQVKSNGYYFEAKPLEAFVTGVRDKGYDVLPMDTVRGPINIVDVIRDPYGSRSYTYREKGTNYHWDYSLNVDVSMNLDINVKMGTMGSYFTGAFTGVGAGAVAGTTGSSSNDLTLDIPIPFLDVNYASAGSYDKTLNDRISTSSDPLDVGAMADVYCGFIDTYNLYRVETFSVIDSTTYRLVKPAIDSGAIRIIQEGKDGNYLAISEKIELSKGKQREFVYTQKHILGTIIPQLEQKLTEILLEGDSTEIQNLANIGKKQLFWLKCGDNVKDSDSIVPIYPRDAENKILRNYAAPEMTPYTIIENIAQWHKVIADNEYRKLSAFANSTPHHSYSLSSASKIEHSESATAFYKDGTWTGSFMGFSIGGGYGWSWRNSAGMKLAGSVGHFLDKYLNKKMGIGDNVANYKKGEQKKDIDGSELEQPFTQEVKLPGFLFRFDFIPDPKFNIDRKKTKKHTRSAGSGYVLETTSNSYLDIDVYQCDDYYLDENFIAQFKPSGSDDTNKEFSKDFWDTVADDPNSKLVSEAKFHDFVFTVRGGAERQPWYAPDSTICYVDSATMKGYPLTKRTQRIDNPKITISDPVVSNIPVGDKAIFSVRLTNESEVTTNMDKELMDPSLFKLFLDEKSCPDGLAITMDGMPLTDGRTFNLKPGESITKTIQVERAGNQYHYENVRLGFRDEAYSLFDYAAISVNYLPASTPVKMARPVDKWVMNTLSAKDEEGRYYLPVEVNGFNTKYDNFDHIELQYKKKSEGDTKWVNICSFYANDSLFNTASGTKEKLKTGTINYRFYGEADPIEMEYDLRAVSFCRLGTGYVTAVSDVMSGLKDTRNPEIFGKPKPTNGVLTFEDVISFPFNEPIAYNYLDKTANFQITGLTNDLNKVYDTALMFSEYSNDAPASKVKRSLAGQDFTWEAMVKLDGNDEVEELFNIHDTDISDDETTRYFILMYDSGKLEATMDGITFCSKVLTNEQDESLKSKLTNVAVTFTNAPVGIKKQMRFYLDGTEVEMDKVEPEYINFGDEQKSLKDDYHITCNVYGMISLGGYMKGIMTDARLWDKALSGAELASKREKVLSKTEPSLMCYWPMDEMMGNVLHDKVSGADLYFTKQTWQMPTGQHSLKLDKQRVDLQTDPTDFMRAEYNDFTLSFWTQINEIAADSVNIFNAGNKDNEQRFTIYIKDEDVIVKSGDFYQSFAKKNALTDGGWHLVTAVTNKSYNFSSMYIDGKMVMTVDGDKFKGMPSNVSIGDGELSASFDNIAFWHLAIPSNSLTTVSNAGPTGREMGLAFFMPFEMDQTNSQDSHSLVFSPYNMVVKKDEEGNEVAPQNRVLPEITGEMDNQSSYPPVRSFGIVQNIPFTWTATNNELQINLNKRDAEINHQYVNVTIRDVEDLAGNPLMNPQMMLVYVDRNVLNWEEPKVQVNVKYGKNKKLTSKLVNKSGRNIYFTLENNCTWLKLSQKDGVSQPLSYDNIDMEISDGLAPGEYVTTVYAVDEDNLSSPLSITVNVEADEPEWKVTNDINYSYTMNIMGQVKLRNEGGMEYLDMDKRDIVGVFHEGICLGKANITIGDNNKSMVNLTVVGNEKMVKDSERGLTFLLWKADANTTSVIVPDTKDNKITFANGTIVGCPPGEPVVFTPTDEIKQTWNLEAGWNWVSLNVKPKDGTDLAHFFDSDNGFSAGDVIMVNGQASEFVVETKPDGTTSGHWNSGINAINNHGKYTYQVYVHRPVKATIYGYAYNGKDRYVKLDPAPENSAIWCHLPYLLSVDQPISRAMSGFGNGRAQAGTVIKNRKLFAVMNNDGKWTGSLDYMHPGEGYFVKHYSNDTIRVDFANTQKTDFAKTVRFEDEDLDSESDNFSVAAGIVSEARTMMPVIANVDDMDAFEEGDEIIAFAKGNAIGSAKVTDAGDGKRLFFISLNAEDGNIVRFAHIRGGEVLAKSRNGIVYDGDAVTGTLDVPYTIDFSSSANDNDDVYDVSGVKYGKLEDVKNRKGVFIIGKDKIAK